MPVTQSFTLCEPTWATPTSRVHVRLVPPGDSPHLGGGVSTPALCGADLRGGWDLPGEVTEDRLRSRLGAETGPTCPVCFQRWWEATQ